MDEVQLAGVVVVDHDVVADMGNADSGDEADVAGTDHGDAHDGRLWFGGVMEVAPDDSRGCRRLINRPASLSGSSPDATLRPPTGIRHPRPPGPSGCSGRRSPGHRPGPGLGRRRPVRWVRGRGPGGAGSGQVRDPGRPATGAVLWGRRSRTPVPPASLTKMLTALAVRASLDLDGVTVASRVAASQPARRLAMRRGQKLTVDQALKALMMVSANDVAVMLAEAAGGSVARFSRPWTPSRSCSACALLAQPARPRCPGHRSTAFDLAILARAVLQDRWLARVVRKRHAAFTTPSGRRHTLTARSRFLLGYRGAVGVKTGFTDDAGHCLAAAPPGAGGP